MMLAIILLVALLAGTISGIIGFGGTTLLLPILVLQYGPKAAVPIMAVAAILGNLARVVAWWRIVSWPAVGAYSATAIPSAWLGARTMLSLNTATLEIILGAFFFLMIPLRRWAAAANFRVSLAGLAMAGAGIGFLTGVVANTGPINTPFFLAHGLTKGAFIGTEAMSSLTMFASKVAAFRNFGALDAGMLASGVTVGSGLIVGTFIAKHFLQSMHEKTFSGLIDVLLLVAAVAMLISAAQHF